MAKSTWQAFQDIWRCTVFFQLDEPELNQGELIVLVQNQVIGWKVSEVPTTKVGLLS